MAPDSRHIQFRFDPEKFTSCVAFLASKNVPNLDKLKIAKLIFFADKLHLQKYCRPITGDYYKHIDFGPVPQHSLDVLNDIEFDRPAGEQGRHNRHVFEERIACNQHARPYPLFHIRHEETFDSLSESEKEILDEVIARYGAMTGGQLIDETHKEAACTKTDYNSTIDYDLLLDDLDDDARAEIIEVLEHDQELRDIFELSS
ncbi:MAG: Panacea domain-containing protein [Thermoleophilia bacterium]